MHAWVGCSRVCGLRWRRVADFWFPFPRLFSYRYYNDEGDIKKINKRSVNYGPGALAYRAILADYAKDGTLKGFEVTV